MPKRSLRVAYSGFDRDIKPSFMACVEERYDIVESDENPDLLLYSIFNGVDHLRYDCHKLVVLGENMDPDPAICDFSVSMRENSERNFYWPLFEPERVLAMLPESEPRAIDPRHAQDKTRFCCFLYSNRAPQERIELCKLLMQRKAVDCPGQVLNNMPMPDRVRLIENRGADQWEEAKRELYSRYRFTISFENEREPLYITSKIFTPLTVGSIPIYWGAPEITELFNPRCFVNCHDFDSLEAVSDHVMAIENDPELYRQYREAPPVLPSSRLYQMTPDAVVGLFDRIVSELDTSTPVSRTVRGRIRSRIRRALFWSMDCMQRFNRKLRVVAPWLRPLHWAFQLAPRHMTLLRAKYWKWLRVKYFWTWRRH